MSLSKKILFLLHCNLSKEKKIQKINHLLEKKDIELYLCDGGLTDTNIAILCSALKDKNITYLNLADNLITDKGAKYLSELSQLQALNLGRNQIGDDGAKDIAKMKLSWLNIMGNHLGYKGAEALANNQTILELEISCNKIGAATQLFANNHNLLGLHIGSGWLSNQKYAPVKDRIEANINNCLKRIKHTLDLYYLKNNSSEFQNNPPNIEKITSNYSPSELPLRQSHLKALIQDSNYQPITTILEGNNLNIKEVQKAINWYVNSNFFKLCAITKNIDGNKKNSINSLPKAMELLIISYLQVTDINLDNTNQPKNAVQPTQNQSFISWLGNFLIK